MLPQNTGSTTLGRDNSDSDHADRAIWLISDGRSGSTWFSRLLGSAYPCHIEHEPIHPLFTPALADEAQLPLPCDTVVENKLVPLFEAIRAGHHRTARFGENDRRTDGGLIIRDVFALMVAPRMVELLPWLRPVVLLRHPCEVASSKCALPDWVWFSQVEMLARDEVLLAAFPRLPRLIARARSPFQRYVLTWCVAHAFLLSHISPARLHVVRYPAPLETARRAIADIMGAHAPESAFHQAYIERSPTDRPPDGRPLLTRLIKPRRAPSAAEWQWSHAMLCEFGLEQWFTTEASRNLKTALTA